MPATVHMLTMPKSETTIGVSKQTHELVKSQKRAGESFDTLLQKMARQYEPEITGGEQLDV